MTTAGWVLTLFYGAIALFFVGAGTWAAIDFVKRRIEDNRFNRRLAAAKNSEQFLDVLMEVSGYFGGLIADEFDVSCEFRLSIFRLANSISSFLSTFIALESKA